MNFDILDQKSLKKFIDRRHPDYERLAPHWSFLEACYEGGRGWFPNNIFPYFKEGELEFKDRLERAYRFNHTREIVDLVNKYIFKVEIERSKEEATTAIKSFWHSSTRNGLNIDQFMRQVSLRSSTFGRIWVVVDNTVAEKEPTTVAEEKELNIRTFAYVVPPQDVLDMSYDEFGDLNWIMLADIARDDKDPFTSSGKAIERIKIWTREEWALFEVSKKGNTVKIALIDEGFHGLNVVPVVKVDHIDSDDEYSAPALIGDIAYLDRAVANYLSNLDAIIQDQTFSQLAIPAQGLMPGDEGNDKIIEMGTKRIFTYDGEGGVAPFYLSPDPKQATMIVTVIKQIINEIYHSVGMAGERTKQDNAAGIDNSSGVAKAYDFERVNALLASKADALDRAEERICELVNLWHGDKAPTVRNDLVKYPDNFDVRGLYDEFEIANQLSLIQAPNLIRREQMKVMVDKLFPRIPKELEEQIQKEIAAWPESIPDPTSQGVLDNVKQENGTKPDGAKDQQTA